MSKECLSCRTYPELLQRSVNQAVDAKKVAGREAHLPELWPAPGVQGVAKGNHQARTVALGARPQYDKGEIRGVGAV